MNELLSTAYKSTRARLASKGFDNRAIRAIEMARAGIERGQSYFHHEPGLASYQNKPGERGGRWIESPEQAGLRFVGFADELTSGCHGWYLYPNGDPDELARGCVYQLPARGGQSVYVEAIRMGESRRGGWRDMSRDGAAYVFLNERHYGEPGGSYREAELAARDAACGADREAEIFAEAEREYQEAFMAGQRVAELQETAKADKAAARELIRELRTLRATVSAAVAPNACAALRQAIRNALADAADCLAKARELQSDWEAPAVSYAAPHWQQRKAELADAFREGLGA